MGGVGKTFTKTFTKTNESEKRYLVLMRFD